MPESRKVCIERWFAITLAVSSLLLFSARTGIAQSSLQGPSASPSPSASPTPADCAEELSVLKIRLALAKSRLEDWAQLDRYREANAKLVPPAKKETRVVFIGDSSTDWWDDEGYGGFFPGKPYVNRGIGGQTTSQMLVRFRQDAIALQPQVVVILAGTNDIAGNKQPTTLEAIENNLATMAELARLHHIRVVLASLLPVSNYERRKDGTQIMRTIHRPPTLIKALNAWIKQYAVSNGHTFLDYYSAVVDEKEMLKDELSDDGLHVNARGYAVMTSLAEQAIKAALKKKI